MLALGNRTGYDIKRVVDFSTRHFWAASYGRSIPSSAPSRSTGSYEVDQSRRAAAFGEEVGAARRVA